jgi:epsilon-lactone hydrolase
MTYIKRIIITVIIIICVIVLGFLAINTTIFKPSLGSRLARMIIIHVSKQMFSENNIVLSMRKVSDTSFTPPLPRGTEVEKIKIAHMNAEWVRAANSKDKINKAILYLHGGGFVMGSCATHRDLIVRISESAGIPILAIEYRLAPEYKYQSMLNDCITAYQWLLKQGFKPENIALGGDSAGASLALMTLISLRDTANPLPKAVFLLSPCTDLIYLDGESYTTRAKKDPMMKKEYWTKIVPLLIGDIKTKPAILSPVRQNLAGLPPMLIQVGNDEILLSDSTRLAERAKKSGVDVTIQVWDHMWHVFQQSAGINPEARQAINNIGTFLKKYL